MRGIAVGVEVEVAVASVVDDFVSGIVDVFNYHKGFGFGSVFNHLGVIKEGEMGI